MQIFIHRAMTFLHWLFLKIELHHNALLAIAALASPFLAIWLGRQQIKSALKTTQLQIRASVGIAYRQQVIDELRRELAAQLDSINALTKHSANSGDAAKHGKDLLQRSFRIGLLVSVGNPHAPEFFAAESHLIRSVDPAEAHASAPEKPPQDIRDVMEAAIRVLDWEFQQAKIS